MAPNNKMTDDTTMREKGRAVFLAAIMLVSMVAIAGAAGPVAAQADGEINVSLEPTEQTVDEGDTVEFEVVIEDPDDGIGAYDVDISLSDGDVASITDFENTQDPDFDNSEIAEDGNSISLEAGMGGNVYAPEDQTTIATITLEGETLDGEDNSTDLNINADDLRVDDQDGDTYDILDVNDGTLNVEVEDDGDDNGDDADDERDADRNFASVADLEGSLVYSGQSISVGVDGQDLTEGEEVQLRRATDDGSTTASLLNVQEDDDGLFVQFNTANRQTADYFLRGGAFVDSAGGRREALGTGSW